ncbi:MAG: iron chelate uptake ABC transporter family permease subunit [Armatimonadota bacterium]|nr:iron chelate uptake ABC transporter family permease subunit [Armatimonadota bacterium]
MSSGPKTTRFTEVPPGYFAKRRRRGLTVAGLALLLLLTTLAATAWGSVAIPIPEVARILIRQFIPSLLPPGDPLAEAIVVLIRLPRVLLAAVVGMALGATGVVYQGLFRNPMADPYILGVSSGAALGATIAILFDLRVWFLGLSATPLLAFAGALGATAAVVRIARRGYGSGTWPVDALPVETLLLAGIAMSAFLSAVISLLLFLGGERLPHAIFWLMGGFSGRGWEHLRMAAPSALSGIAIAFFLSPDLNLLLTGEEEAFQLGVDVERVKRFLIVAASLAAASAAATSGLIGFVGLIVPHLVRFFVGPDHRWLLPASALLGGTILVVADLFARTLLSPQELPVGVITAFLGGPFFLFLLARRKGPSRAY